MYPTRKLNLSTRSGPSWRAVLALTLGVSVLHAWLLAAGPSQLTVTQAMAQAATLHTRTVPAAADLQAPAPRVSSRAVAPNPRTEEAGMVAPPAPATATISAGVTEALPPGPGPVEPSLPEPVVAAATDERPPAPPTPASPARSRRPARRLMRKRPRQPHRRPTQGRPALRWPSRYRGRSGYATRSLAALAVSSCRPAANWTGSTMVSATRAGWPSAAFRCPAACRPALAKSRPKACPAPFFRPYAQRGGGALPA